MTIVCALYIGTSNPAIANQNAALPLALEPGDFNDFEQRQYEVGRLLFFDPILSGNRNIACSTCHNKAFGTSDGLPLGIGEGGVGVGNLRSVGSGDNRIRKRIPRNSLALWNLGARQVELLFHDGRLSKSNIFGNGFNSVAEESLPKGLANILSAQALFPMVSQFEMAGNPKENEVAGAIHDRIDNAWPIIVERVSAIAEYVDLFRDSFDDVHHAGDITIVYIGNAIGSFIGIEGQSMDSPFDDFLRGDTRALSAQQRKGMEHFYGDAGCSQCHSGNLLSDFRFHALALPQFGPGRTRVFDPYTRDLGRMAESDRLEDAYRFRTPSLRNVELTAPYGHNGAYRTLEKIISHHLNPIESLDNWQPKEVDLPAAQWLAVTDFIVLDDVREQQRLRSNVDIREKQLSQKTIDDLVAFMKALTGTQSVDNAFTKPATVPSGLPVE